MSLKHHVADYFSLHSAEFILLPISIFQLRGLGTPRKLIWCGASALGHRGTLAAQVSSAPHQMKKSESALSSSSCAEQPFSSLLPHT